jgi:hypothetical protein
VYIFLVVSLLEGYIQSLSLYSGPNPVTWRALLDTVSARSNGFPLSLFTIPSARPNCVARINLNSAGSYRAATQAACSSTGPRACNLRHVCPSREGSVLTSGGVCGALHARSLPIGFLRYTEPHWTQSDAKELVYLIQCRDNTYLLVSSVSEGNQEWPQGHSQCSSTADEILSGTVEDREKPVVPILSHMIPIHSLTFNFCEIHFPRTNSELRITAEDSVL